MLREILEEARDLVVTDYTEMRTVPCIPLAEAMVLISDAYDTGLSRAKTLINREEEDEDTY